MASRRRRNNRILRIRGENNDWFDINEGIQKVFVDYFTDIFTTSNPSFVEEFLKAMDKRVSDEMNNMLDKPFTEDDVNKAIDQMHLHKSSGPNGMTACFYQRYWTSIRQGCGKVILDFLNNGGSLSHINNTNVVLIPKKKGD